MTEENEQIKSELNYWNELYAQENELENVGEQNEEVESCGIRQGWWALLIVTRPSRAHFCQQTRPMLQMIAQSRDSPLWY